MSHIRPLIYCRKKWVSVTHLNFAEHSVILIKLCVGLNNGTINQTEIDLFIMIMLLLVISPGHFLQLLTQ